MTTNALQNKGTVLLKAPNDEAQKTFVVVGVARGGTSIVAGLLFHLGINMGKAASPVFEDLRLSSAFERNSKEKFVDVVELYNKTSDVWAWKRPSTLHALPAIAKKLRNPHFIFVFRDMLSIANRNVLSMHQPIGKGIQNALSDYRKIAKFIDKSKHPALLVSSEKVVNNKDSFITAISEFCQITPSERQVHAAMEFLTPNPSEYLQATRLTRAKGSIDENYLATGVVKGWACYAVNHGEATIEVLVNQTVVATATANQFDEQYNNRGIHPTGHCGFEVDLKPLGVTPQDTIEVKVKGDIVNLHEEPLTFGDIDTWLALSDVSEFITPMGTVNQNLLQTGLLSGWVTTNHAKTPAVVTVRVNGQEFATLTASMHRPNVQKSGKHPTGHCGFELNLKQYGVVPSDEVEVRVNNAKVTLHKHPLTFSHLPQWLTRQQLKELNEQKGSQQ